MTCLPVEDFEALKAEVGRLTAVLQEIAAVDKVVHPEQSDLWIISHSAAGHRRCHEIARNALKKVIPDAAHD